MIEDKSNQNENQPPSSKKKGGERGTFAKADLPTGGGATGQHRAAPLLTEKEEWKKIGEATYIDPAFERVRLIVLAILLVPLMGIAYFQSIHDIVRVWYRVQDYSHGFLIVPLVIYFLWIRFDTYPGTQKSLCWFGLIPIMFSFVARYFGSLQYMEAVEQWSIFLWIIGIVWLLYGSRVFLWALPSMSFLLFMFPLPYRLNVNMRQELQQIAAQFAAFLLQTIGQPAINFKTTIRLGLLEIGVEAACSGIRFLVSFFAIAIGTILLLRRPWWQNLFILAGVVPIALFINAIRIVMTSLFIKYCSATLEGFSKEGQSVGVVADKFAGYIAIGMAFALFALFVFYLTRVFRKVNLLQN
ncbi:MAG: exosortase/archaeosortase family protein [Planctomycetaceae bacterium]|nr:exosortase/archaeosortase family protein [Planctomycetaceae bacterium]